MGEVPLWATILVPILIFGGLIWDAGGLKGFFQRFRDEYQRRGLKGNLLFLLAAAAWILFMIWITR